MSNETKFIISLLEVLERLSERVMLFGLAIAIILEFLIVWLHSVVVMDKIKLVLETSFLLILIVIIILLLVVAIMQKKAKKYHVPKYLVKLFDFPEDGGNITIIVPSVERARSSSIIKAQNYPCYKFESAVDDVMTLRAILPSLVALHGTNRVNIRFSEELDTSDVLGHRIYIGAPATNKLTTHGLRGCYYQFDKRNKYTIVGSGRENFRTVIKRIEGKDLIVEDFGLITRRKDENGFCHVVIAGCHAYGQLGLADVLECGKVLEGELRTLENFQAVFKTTVENTARIRTEIESKKQ